MSIDYDRFETPADNLAKTPKQIKVTHKAREPYQVIVVRTLDNIQ